MVLVSHSGSIDDMANILSISSPGDGGRLLEEGISRVELIREASRHFLTDTIT